MCYKGREEIILLVGGGAMYSGVFLYIAHRLIDPLHEKLRGHLHAAFHNLCRRLPVDAPKNG